MAQLLIISDTGDSSSHAITSDTITIGRRRENSLCIPHLSISGFHARITHDRGALVLEDLQSTNGTLVNGEPITRHVLIHRDEIAIGMYYIQYAENDLEYVPVPEHDVTATLPPTALDPSPAATLVSSESADIVPLHHADDRIDPILPIATEATETSAKPTIAVGDSLEDDIGSIVSEIAALRVESGPKSGDVFVLEKNVTTLGKRGDQAGAIARKESGYYFVPLCLDAGRGNIKHNGSGLTQKSEIKLSTGDNLELAGAKLEFIYPFYR